MDEHDGNDAGLAHAPCRQPQHFSAAGLHGKIVERANVRAGADAQRPAEYALDLALQHGRLDHVLAPLPEARVLPAVPLDDAAGDQWMTVEAARERRHAHPVIDPELQRLHPVAHFRALFLPAHRVRVVGETAQPCERVIDVPCDKRPSARRHRRRQRQYRLPVCANRDRLRSCRARTT